MIVLWPIQALDWSRYTSVEYIRERLVNKVRPGGITKERWISKDQIPSNAANAVYPIIFHA